MKTKIFIMLCMMVCAHGMFAQTNENFESQDQDTTEVADVTPEVEQTPTPAPAPAPAKDNYEELTQLLREFHKHALAEQQLEKPNYDSVYVPVRGHTKFTRRQKITQRLEISVLGGTDKPEDSEDLEDYRDDAQRNDNTANNNPVNMGLNIGYSVVFVPGHLEEDKLLLNRFGFGYSLGFIASMDKQDKYGTTCDLLAKIGVETGNGHAMGIGIDALFGTGNSPVSANIPLTKDYTYMEHDTKWCLKYGFQLWVRSNLLHANIKNVDIRLFARYIYSKDPTNDADLDFNEDSVPSGYFIWNPESWQFGLTFCYEF